MLSTKEEIIIETKSKHHLPLLCCYMGAARARRALWERMGNEWGGEWELKLKVGRLRGEWVRPLNAGTQPRWPAPLVACQLMATPSRRNNVAYCWSVELVQHRFLTCLSTLLFAFLGSMGWLKAVSIPESKGCMTLLICLLLTFWGPWIKRFSLGEGFFLFCVEEDSFDVYSWALDLWIIGNIF